MTPRIRVVCRKRPLNRREISNRYTDVVTCDSSAVFVREPKVKVDLTRFTEEHTFQFDGSYEDTVSNEELYNSCVQSLVLSFLEDKAKCTCFCFGQTGSGKT
jgi:kinesin family protein 2/24